jgi:ribonuclease HII
MSAQEIVLSKAKKQQHQCLATKYIDASGCEITNSHIIGVDEAGRGPLFGRVYTAAVILPPDISDSNSNSDSDSHKFGFDYSLMKDSKKFHSDKKIRAASDYIKSHHAVNWAISYEEADVIDRLNIRKATLQCMRTSIETVMKKHGGSGYMLLIDGNDFIPMGKFNKDAGEMEYIPHTCIEGGDNKYACIAAASILAKVARDEYIEKLCDEYPVLDELYSLRGNKGYGAKKHLDGIREHGITQWHRRSYGICKTFE